MKNTLCNYALKHKIRQTHGNLIRMCSMFINKFVTHEPFKYTFFTPATLVILNPTKPNTTYKVKHTQKKHPTHTTETQPRQHLNI